MLLTTSWPTSREAKVPLTTSSVADNQTPGGAKVPTTAPLRSRSWPTICSSR